MLRHTRAVLGALLYAGSASGHGTMIHPPARSNGPLAGSDGTMWFSQGCSVGCAECSGLNNRTGCNCQQCIKPTISKEAERTWYPERRSGGILDFWQTHPWRAPGSSPVLDPCGVASGSWLDNTAAGGTVPPGQVAGAPGSHLRPDPAHPTVQWVAGATVDVEWKIAANHGGGYHYRLCPRSEPLTEACFSRTPLSFHEGTTQRIRYPNGTTYEIPAVIVDEGTVPAGSQWARNPIPACREPDGGFTNPCGEDKLQFPPPPDCDDTCWGYGTQAHNPGHQSVSIIDRVVVPAHLPAGDYVVGWRWDSEHTPQIWSQCGDVAVVAR